MNAPEKARSAAPESGSLLVREGSWVLALTALTAAALRDPASWPEGGLIVDFALGAALLLSAIQGALRAPRGPLLLLACGVALVSSLLAADRGAALAGLQHEARLIAAFWLGCSLAAQAAGLPRMAWGLACSGALAALHAAWQVFIGHPALVAAHPGMPEMMRAQLLDGRANSVFLLPAHLGSFAAAALAAALALAWSSTGRRRAVALTLALSCFAGLGLAGSIGGVALAAAGALVVTLTRVPARWRMRAALAGAVLLSIVLAASLLRRADLSRESPWSARARNWATAVTLIREEPLFGHGPGSFGTEHARARPERSNDVQHAHQAWLQAGAEQGVVLMILLALFAWTLGRGWLRLATPAGLSLSIAGGIFVGESLIDFGWMTVTWGVPAALVLGASWATERAREAPSRRVLALAGIAWTMILGAGMAIALAGLRAEAAKALAAQSRHEDARRLLASAARLQPLDDGRWRELAGAELLLFRQSGQSRHDLLRSAETHARNAVRASPRKAAGHALLAEILTLRGEVGAAAASAWRAWELAPWDAALREARDDAWSAHAGADAP